MTTVKSYTDIEQSKKLAEILPLESADMLWEQHGTEHYVTIKPWTTIGKSIGCHCLSCWSLAALLGVLPEIDDTSLILEKVKAEDGYDGYYYHIEYKDKILIPYSKNPIDACVAMIEKLNELKML